MNRKKLLRLTTVPISLEKLLEGQLTFMQQYYDLTAISAEKERLEKYGQDNGVATFHVEMTREITPLKDLKAVLKLYKFLKREKPLIVHTHTPKAGIVGMLASKMAGIPLRLHTVAGLPLLETQGIKRKVLRAVEKLTYSMATNVYPNSKGLHQIILNEGFAPPSKLKILGKGSSNGIDTSYFDPSRYSDEQKHQLKIRHEIPEQDVVFVFVGRLVSEKGINELVSAFGKLNSEKTNTSLLLVGPVEEELDPLSPKTAQIIRDHEKIYTTGFQNDVRPFLSISDVLAFPSYREGFPNVVMQAGAMNLPSIVSNINGCNEIISNGKNGLIVPPKDEGALLNAMFTLVGNKDYRIKLAESARKEIVTNYERAEFWKLLLKEYQSIQNSYISKYR